MSLALYACGVGGALGSDSPHRPSDDEAALEKTKRRQEDQPIGEAELVKRMELGYEVVVCISKF